MRKKMVPIFSGGGVCSVSASGAAMAEEARSRSNARKTFVQAGASERNLQGLKWTWRRSRTRMGPVGLAGIPGSDRLGPDIVPGHR